MTRSEFDESIRDTFNVLWSDLVYFLVRLGCEWIDANDIVQSTYLELIEKKKYDRFKILHKGSLYGFFRLSVHYTYLSFLREQAKLRALHEPTNFYETGTDDEPSKAETQFKEKWTPLRTLEAKQVQAAMHRALDKLPISLQEAIERHYAERVPVRVIATELGLKEKTLASRLIRFRFKLQKLLKAHADI